MTQTLDARDHGIAITESDHRRLDEILQSEGHRHVNPALLRALRQELERSNVVPDSDVSSVVVTMNTQVRVRDLDLGGTAVYTLVYPEQADIETGKISVLAPMGLALLGARLGDTVEFDTPGGRRRLKIVKVPYQPEAWGHTHL